jgi:FkbM family methyltransferase
MNLNLIKKYFVPDHVLDIGGHTGEFCQLVLNYFPKASIFIVEGNKECEPYLQKLNVPYLIKVLGKEKKETIFYKTTDNKISTGNSLYKEITPHFSEKNTIKEIVKQDTIDTTFKEANFDLIKIDTQGSELDILEGGKRICQKAKGILLEVSILKYNEGSPLYKEVKEYMKSYGFIEKEVLAEFHTTTNYNLEVHQKDILFVNKNLL